MRLTYAFLPSPARFNLFYDKWLDRELGAGMREAKGGGGVRLECNGVQFLRTVCRLTHNGAQQYAKVRPYPFT